MVAAVAVVAAAVAVAVMAVAAAVLVMMVMVAAAVAVMAVVIAVVTEPQGTLGSVRPAGAAWSPLGLQGHPHVAGECGGPGGGLSGSPSLAPVGSNPWGRLSTRREGRDVGFPREVPSRPLSCREAPSPGQWPV